MGVLKCTVCKQVVLFAFEEFYSIGFVFSGRLSKDFTFIHLLLCEINMGCCKDTFKFVMLIMNIIMMAVGGFLLYCGIMLMTSNQGTLFEMNSKPVIITLSAGAFTILGSLFGIFGAYSEKKRMSWSVSSIHLDCVDHSSYYDCSFACWKEAC